MSSSSLCSQCGTPLKAGERTCPRCSLALGLDAQPSSSTHPAGGLYLDDLPIPSESTLPVVDADLSASSGVRRLGRYSLFEKLGAGGMGEVFRGRDMDLGREVAIKLLPPELVADPDRFKRFQQEARLLAALNHANILTLHDVGLHQGIPYLVSELLQGTTLGKRMHASPLSIASALNYALQIVKALTAAHDRGVIHRDLKPENLFLTQDGVVKLLDFGIARVAPSEPRRRSDSHLINPANSETALGPRPSEVDDMPLTGTGQILGTPGYMSPEQVRGESLDARTDIFAFGCVLYEMLLGKRPFQRDSAVATLAAILHESPPGLTPHDSNLPPALAAIVLRCLEKAPDKRFQSAKDLAGALEAVVLSVHSTSGRTHNKGGATSRQRLLLLGSAALVLLLLGFTRWLWNHPGQKPNLATATPIAQGRMGDVEQRSIAVLPFVSLSADKGDEYLSDGMTEELLNMLAQVPGLRVPGRSSSFAFKGKTEDYIFRKVGDQLHVTTVLEGSVRKAGEKLRITAQLINVSDGFHLWSQTYDRDMKDILAVQTEVAQQVVHALQVKLGVETARALAKPSTVNPEAHRLYLLGRYHFGRNTAAGLTNAIQSFTQALQQDRAYALAYCGLADCYGWMGGGRLSGKEAWAKEKELAQKACTLDPNLAEAHLSLGIALANTFEWNLGEQEIKRALRLNPRLPLAYDQLAWIQMLFGRFDEAIENERTAVELDQLSLMFQSSLAERLMVARRYDKAIEQLDKTLELDSHFADAHLNLGWIHIYKGEADKALAAWQKAKALDPSPLSETTVAYAYARVGERAKAEQMLKDLDEKAKHRYISPSLRMLLHLGLGNKDKALDWLDRCYAEQDWICWGLKVYPLFDPLRAEPRFKALLKKVGFDQ